MRSLSLSLFFFITIVLTTGTTGTATAQFAITPGAHFFLTGNALLTLQNIDLVNNGDFQPGSSLTKFTGNTNSAISGSQPIQFFEMEMNKTGVSSVLLNSSVNTTQRILFTSGFLDLNGFNMDLGTTAFLDGEQESSRITGANGGLVLFSTTLNNPSSANPGNLGAIISSGANLGNVQIKRGQQSQTNGITNASSILRFYDIIPANNTGLNATLRFNYFDGELNNLNETALELVQSTSPVTANGPITFSSLGFTSKDADLNFVERTGLDSFARMTVSTIGNPLPILFTGFNATCAGNTVLLTWQTGLEQNSSHFNIEKSTDGTRWTTIATLPAAGASANQKEYSYTDNDPGNAGDYRIAEVDLGGSQEFTRIIRTSCGLADGFTVWPNPFHDRVFVNIIAGNASQALIRVFDSKGALVKIQPATLLQGVNQVGIDLQSLAAGLYQLSVDWDNGAAKRTVQILKQ